MEDINIIHKKLSAYFNELIKEGTIYDVQSLEYNFVSESPSRDSDKENFTTKKFGKLKIKILFYLRFEEKNFFGERFSSEGYDNAENTLEDIKIRVKAMIDMRNAIKTIVPKEKKKKLTPQEKRKQELKEELKTCLRNENYERASEIRKKIDAQELKDNNPNPQ